MARKTRGARRAPNAKRSRVVETNGAGGNGDYLALQDLARYLRLSPFTVYQWRSRGRFPFKAKKVGRSVMVAKAEADRYLAKNGAKGRPRRSRVAAGKSARRTRPPARSARPAIRRARSGRPSQGLGLTLAAHTTLHDVQSFVSAIQRGGRVGLSFGSGSSDSVRIRVE
jgi:predicted DNA-binding transcriptional regulator AlpA